MGEAGSDLNSLAQGVAAVAWPAGRRGIVPRLLFAAEVAPRGTLKAPVTGAERLIVELEALSVVAVEQFEAAVAAGKANDSQAGFLRFASEVSDRRLVFLNRWTEVKDAGPRLVVPLAQLRADPTLWIGRILDFMHPGSGDDRMDGAREVDRAIQALAAHPTPDLTGFRYYDTELFDLLDRLALKRAVVQTMFRRVIGRDPTEAATLQFQAMESNRHLRQALTASREFRQQRDKQEFPGFAEASPEVLKSNAYARWSRQQKTKLGWPLDQVFVSHGARLLYCPIGKVACTFLKQQMVRISDVAHADFILASVHVRTDGLKTGLQLCDYPAQTARNLMTSPEFLRFAVLRDPADRLLSAYIEKFVIGRNVPANIHHTRGLVAAVQARQGLSEPDMDRGISFRDFLKGIAAESPEMLDPHWRPQALYLRGMVYDRLFALERIDAVVDLLEARSGLVLPRQAQNVTDSGTGTDCPGAADLLPAEILARPRIGKTSFFEAELLALIQEYFGEDAQLHRAALEKDEGMGG